MQSHIPTTKFLALLTLLTLATLIALSGASAASASTLAKAGSPVTPGDSTSMEDSAPENAVSPGSQIDWSMPPLVPHYEDKAIVLLYHHISPTPSGGSTITPEHFRSHLEYLRAAGFNVVSVARLERFLVSGEPLPPNAVVITFDDGYESFYRYAYPALKEFGYPATVFVIVSSVGVTPVGGHIPHFGWAEMREMVASGLVSFGSHTYDQHKYVKVDANGTERPALVGRMYDAESMAQETAEWYENRVRLDLALSKALMEEHLGIPVEDFAVPYGAANGTVTRTAKELGFKHVFLVASGVVERGADHYFLKRVNAGSPWTDIPGLVEAVKIALDPAYRAPGYERQLPGPGGGMIAY